MQRAPPSSENMKKKHDRGGSQQQQRATSSPAQNQRLGSWPTPKSCIACGPISQASIRGRSATNIPPGRTVISILLKMTPILKISMPKLSDNFPRRQNNYYSADFTGLHSSEGPRFL